MLVLFHFTNWLVCASSFNSLPPLLFADRIYLIFRVNFTRVRLLLFRWISLVFFVFFFFKFVGYNLWCFCVSTDFNFILSKFGRLFGVLLGLSVCMHGVHAITHRDDDYYDAVDVYNAAVKLNLAMGWACVYECVCVCVKPSGTKPRQAMMILI